MLFSKPVFVFKLLKLLVFMFVFELVYAFAFVFVFTLAFVFMLLLFNKPNAPTDPIAPTPIPPRVPTFALRLLPNPLVLILL